MSEEAYYWYTIMATATLISEYGEDQVMADITKCQKTMEASSCADRSWEDPVSR